MKSLDSLGQRLGKVGQLSLETSDTLTTLVSEFGSVGTVIGHRAFDKLTHSPVVTLIVLPIELAVNGRSHGQCLTTRIATGSSNLLLQVSSHLSDVVHHGGHIGEDSVILTLEDVVGSVTYGLNDKSIVDKTFTKGLDDFNVAFDCEVRSDAKHSFVHVCILVLVLIHNDYRTKVW